MDFQDFYVKKCKNYNKQDIKDVYFYKTKKVWYNNCRDIGGGKIWFFISIRIQKQYYVFRRKWVR